jgi:hypothetical protein
MLGFVLTTHTGEEDHAKEKHQHICRTKVRLQVDKVAGNVRLQNVALDVTLTYLTSLSGEYDIVAVHLFIRTPLYLHRWRLNDLDLIIQQIHERPYTFSGRQHDHVVIVIVIVVKGQINSARHRTTLT